MSPDASTDAPTGWVYRSAPQPAAAAPAARASVAPPRPEPRPAVSSSTPSRSWVERGLQMMTVPVAITVGVMLAPMFWMLAPRTRH